jgi:protein-tyrosine phosphatase
MIDLHGHYLPGVDDGAVDMEMSLAMLRLAAADGIAAVAVTPHACSSLCKARDFDSLRRSWSEWGAGIEKEDLQMNIVSGAEVFFTSDLLPILKDHRDLLTINNGSYFLLEFPADYVYAHSKEFIFKLLTEDLIPVISHAERNQEIQRSPAILRELVKAGALCQVNAGSFRGDFGNNARRCAYELLRDNLVHVIASDAHDLEKRQPGLSFVRPLLQGVDAEKADLYLHGIPAAIIADEAIPDIGEPVSHHSRRSFFDLFRKRDS